LDDEIPIREIHDDVCGTAVSLIEIDPKQLGPETPNKVLESETE